MHEMVRRATPVAAKAVEGGTRSRPSMRVGPVEDAAERDADRMAEAAMRTFGRRASGSVDPVMTGAVTRIQRSDEPVIRRSVYLFNEDDSIYKDSEDDSLELAFIQKLKSSSIFVKYGAIERVRFSTAFREITGAYTGVAPVKHPKLLDPADALGISSIGLFNPKAALKAKVAGAKAKAKADASALAGSDRSQDIRRDVLLAVKRNTALGQRLVAALGDVYVYDRDDGEFAIADLSAAHLAQIMCDALFRGPSQMRTGGGSRLPAAAGFLWVYGADHLSKDQALQLLGVPVEELPKYARVAVRFVDWGTYQRRVDTVAGANNYEFTSHDESIRAIYTSHVETARASNSRIQVDGTAYFADADFLGIAANSTAGQRIAARYANLGPATADSGWIPGTQLTAAGRGKGQAAAMQQWNALGAAAYANVHLGRHYDLSQNWEWLHIRGAQLGGATNGTNLVAGLYVTNSAMIPFEAMIERWARAGPTHFHARFRATGIAGAFCDRIVLSIKADQHPELGTLDEHMLVSFDPVSGKIVDKLAGELIKRAIDRRVGV